MKITSKTKARSSNIWGTDFTSEIIELRNAELLTISRIGLRSLTILIVLRMEKSPEDFNAISSKEMTTMKKSRQFHGDLK